MAEKHGTEISKKLAHPERFEPPTSAFGGQRSIQLSYGCIRDAEGQGPRLNGRNLAKAGDGRNQRFLVFCHPDFHAKTGTTPSIGTLRRAAARDSRTRTSGLAGTTI